ncbi:MAG: RNA polymerase sigma factor RpoD/SigA [Spirochaetales bacterium]|nr:RNA polymerase sigma factor RpoD/SigA [Spirochaetales bacterium]
MTANSKGLTKKKKQKAKIRGNKVDGNNIIALYLRDINRYDLLSREEEKQYAILAAKGDIKSKEKLINANLRFVVNVAKQYQNQGLPLEDLISEGNIGLMNAIDKFDVEKGYHFISYAVWWIRQRILKAISEKSRMIRLPMNRIYEISKIEKVKDNLQNKKGLEAKISEIASQLNMEKELVSELLNISKEMLSLDNPIYIEKDSTLLKDFIADTTYQSPTEIVMNNSLKDDINEILKSLTAKEASILEYRFGLNGKVPSSLREIGNLFNLTKERIRQIEKRAIDRLKTNEDIKLLRNYLS